MSATAGMTATGSRKRQGSTVDDEMEQRKRERESRVFARFDGMSRDETIEALQVISRKWNLLNTQQAQSFNDIIETTFHNFGITLADGLHAQAADGTQGLIKLDGAIHEAEMEAVALYQKLREHEALADECVLKQAVACLEQVYYAKRLVLSTYQGLRCAKNITDEHEASGQREASDTFLDQSLGNWSLRFRWIDQDIVPFQKLLLYLLDRAVDKSYRRQGDLCFEPVIINDNNTHAWRAAMTIREFIYSQTQKETNFEQWTWMTANHNTPKAIEQYLINCVDYSFPPLKKDRSTFSFANGVYRAKENMFYPYPADLGAHVAACKYFDNEFPASFVDIDDPMMIPTPFLDSIMEYQEWEIDVQKWLFIMLGRLLYNLNDLDAWQVIPFMAGQASSGKCVSRDTLCMMSDMSVKVVQDIRVGDCLMGDDGTPRQVLGLARGREELFEVQWKHGSFQCTGEHILCLKYSNQKSIGTWRVNGVVYGKKVYFWDPDTNTCREKKFTTANAENMRVFLDSLDKNDVFEMTVNEYLKLKPYVQGYLKMYFPDRMEFPECVDPPFDPYIFGVWLGDGTSANSQLTNFDQEVLDGVKENLPANLQLTGLSRDGYYSMKKTSGNTNEFTEFLRSYDLVNNKHIPQDFLRMNVSNRLELMAGLMDTDGWKLANANPHFEIVQKSQTLAEGIRRLAISLGFACSMCQTEKSCTWKGEKRTGTYRLFICGDGLEDIPCRMERKRIPPGHRGRNPTVFGFTVRHVPGVQEYFGFQVDGNQRFCLASGIVSHNSTITLKVAKSFYEDVDVGTLSNNIETKFGLSQFYSKLLYVAPEIKSDLRIEQAEFQSIVSGEDITINVKNRTAFSTQWTVPGILAGNEVPSWADNSGSIQRRIVLFDFPKQVTHGDMRLAEKLQDEMPAILLKANRLYLDTVKKHGADNVWTILPAYFQRTRAELAATTNVLEAFLVSDSVIIQPEQVVSMDDFKMAVRTFATANNFSVKRFTKEFFRGCFDKHAIVRRKETREYRGRMVTKEFLHGVGLNETNQQHALG